MRTGYTIKVEQHEQIRELTTKVEALMDGVDPRVRIAALAHQMACAVEDLSCTNQPTHVMEEVAKGHVWQATNVARHLNPLSQDY